MDKVYIKFNPYQMHAGYKANRDAEIIANLMGFKTKMLSSKGSKVKIKVFLPLTEIINIPAVLRLKNEILFTQNPYPLFIIELFAKRINKRNKTIIISHDIDPFRYNYGEKKIKKYASSLNGATCIISHNLRYTEMLRELGVTAPIVELGIFDYVLKSAPKKTVENFKSVAFAGNLEKSEFINAWLKSERNYSIELIGIGFNSEDHKDIPHYVYRGSFSPDEVPFKITSGFGLVWDGSSIENCNVGGILAQYLKINCPHKFSQYMASGTPVFVWRESALASFVKEHDVGYAISSLSEINDILKNMSRDRYSELLNNVSKIQERVVHGLYLKEALEKALKIIECQNN